MQIEKISENKIRITLNIKDLEEKHIDFHSFMSNPITSQDLFFDMLKEAETKIGFVTDNYQIRIEALAMSSGDFIITITRTLPENDLLKSPLKKKLKVKRKSLNTNFPQAVYSFENYDDFYNFMKSIKNQNINIKNIAKTINLYEYKNTYYLVINKINTENCSINKFYSLISEFATYINHSELFISRLSEVGDLVIKNSAITKYINFIK